MIEHTAYSVRRCEERSDEAIQTFFLGPGLLRFARNDGLKRFGGFSVKFPG
jgi:hypothetical protein